MKYNLKGGKKNSPKGENYLKMQGKNVNNFVFFLFRQNSMENISVWYTNDEENTGRKKKRQKKEKQTNKKI